MAASDDNPAPRLADDDDDDDDEDEDFAPTHEDEDDDDDDDDDEGEPEPEQRRRGKTSAAVDVAPVATPRTTRSSVAALSGARQSASQQQVVGQKQETASDKQRADDIWAMLNAQPATATTTSTTASGTSTSTSTPTTSSSASTVAASPVGTPRSSRFSFDPAKAVSPVAERTSSPALAVVSEVYDFAGEAVVCVLVPPHATLFTSAAADRCAAWRSFSSVKKTVAVTGSDSSAAGGGGAVTTGAAAAAADTPKRGVDAVLASLKKKKMSTLFKSQHDWEHFKDKEGIADELAQSSKDGYLAKRAFLEESDVREHEVMLANKRRRLQPPS